MREGRLRLRPPFSFSKRLPIPAVERDGQGSEFTCRLSNRCHVSDAPCAVHQVAGFVRHAAGGVGSVETVVLHHYCPKILLLVRR